MKKLIILPMLIMAMTVQSFAATGGILPPDSKVLTDKFAELNKIETLVNENAGLTVSGMQAGSHASMLTSANFDLDNMHQKPHKKGFPTFKEHPWYYIIGGLVILLFVGIFILTGGEGVTFSAGA
jgi:hypothetical protein